MPILAGATKIVLAGHLAGGEIFETGFWVVGSAITSNAAANAFATAVEGAFTTAGTKPQMRSYITSASGFDEIRVYHYTGASTATYIGSKTVSPTSSGTGTTAHPDQVCVVASLRTGQAGRSYRGRMYWPANGIAVALDSQIVLLDAQQISDSVAAWLIAVRGIALGVTPVVVSQTLGTASVITQVRVDTRLDIQRRRANSQAINNVAMTTV